MWGFELDPYLVEDGQLDKHVWYVMQRNMNQKTTQQFIEMLF